MSGVVQSWPNLLLRIEGTCLFAATTWAYSLTGQSWWAFAGGLLLPDLGMIGYLANTTAGSITYNAVHTEIMPVILLCAAYARGRTLQSGAVAASFIWLAHINMDRMIAAGLKYHDGFGHTHLGHW